MSLRLVFVDDRTAEFREGERLLARYCAAPDVPANESPKPCLHPVNTLAGELVTAFRPADHLWHHGIAWAFTYIDDDTFWGGPTFVDAAQGYQWRDNHGWQRHVSWQAVASPPGGSDLISLRQNLHWISSTGQILLAETRVISAAVKDDATWRLNFASEFANVTDRALVLRSPVGRGRPSGGYFGLMWRGPLSWANGKVHSAAAHPEMMGHSAPWLAYERTAHDSSAANLQFIDHPSNRCFPTPWFVRREAEPIASFAFAYAEPMTLAPQSQLSLRYAIVIADRLFSHERAEQLAQEYWHSSSASAR